VTRIVGDRVVLRPFRDGDLQRLLDVTAGWPVDDGIHWGPRERDGLQRKIEVSGEWTDEGQLDLAVESEGRLVGDAQARSVRGAMPRGVFELGIEVFDDSDRGRGLGAAAVAALTRHLFTDEEAIRVQLSTDVDNGAMRAVADRLGFGFEGVLRGFMPTASGPRDYAMYGMTRTDYEKWKTTWI
jgi:RimJ/RimL family protein N-acetyltransferase